MGHFRCSSYVVSLLALYAHPGSFNSPGLTPFACNCVHAYCVSIISFSTCASECWCCCRCCCCCYSFLALLILLLHRVRCYSHKNHKWELVANGRVFIFQFILCWEWELRCANNVFVVIFFSPSSTLYISHLHPAIASIRSIKGYSLTSQPYWFISVNSRSKNNFTLHWWKHICVCWHVCRRAIIILLTMDHTVHIDGIRHTRALLHAATRALPNVAPIDGTWLSLTCIDHDWMRRMVK